MSKDYPHINDTKFPDIDTVNVYKYQNNFDYNRWKADVTCKLCNVTWDSDYNNVVKFEDDTKRNAYFETISGQKVNLSIANHKLVDNSLKVPLPFDVCNYYNYVILDYPTPTSDTKPLMYELPPRRSKFFYFIKDYKSLAGNTTELFLQLDSWTTYINSVDIKYMMLSRGHYPVAKTNVDTYLSNPIENNELLLEADITKNTASNIKSEKHIILNDKDTMCVIACACDPTQNDWGDYKEVDKIPTTNVHIPSIGGLGLANEGVPNCYTFALNVSDLDTLLYYLNWNIPQFYRTVKAVFFISKSFINLKTSFTFGGNKTNIKCWSCNGKHQTLELIKLNKEQFGYDSNYKHLAKLYTSPYAYIEINNEQGSIANIKIEDIANGKIDVNFMVSFAISNLNVEANLLNVNGTTTNSITFKNLAETNFSYNGNWYKTFIKWDIPTFAIYCTPINDNAITSFYGRKQAKIALDNQYDNAVDTATTNRANTNRSATTNRANTNRSATTDRANTNRSATTDKNNANRSATANLNNANLNADTQISNTALNTTATKANTDKNNSTMWTDTNYSNDLNQALQAYTAGYNRDTQVAEAQAETVNAGLSIAGGVASGLASGNPVSAVGSAISGVVQAAQTWNSINLAKTKVELGITQSQNEVDNRNRNSSDKCTLQQETQSALTTIANNNQISQTANTAQNTRNTATNTYNANITNAQELYNTTTENAQQLYNTTTENSEATRDLGMTVAQRNKDTATNAIYNQWYQDHLDASHNYGIDNALSATQKPMGLWANVVTQNKSAIHSIGDEFLRYGYTLNQQVKVESLTLMKHFTYWLASDIINTLEDVSINKNEQQSIIDIFKHGVTIWSKPEEIGAISIYDN